MRHTRAEKRAARRSRSRLYASAGMLALAIAAGLPPFEGRVEPGLGSSLAAPPEDSASSPIRDLAWAPDSRRLAAIVDPAVVQTWRMPEGRHELTLNVPEESFVLNRMMASVSWSPDGATLLTEVPSEVALLWASDTGRLRETLREAMWSGDGKLLAVLSRDRRRVEIRQGATGRVLAVHPALVGGWGILASWSPDGHSLVFESATGYALWRAGAGVLKARLALGEWIGFHFDWSPDSRLLATFGQEGGYTDQDILLWDVRTARRRAVLRGGRDEYAGECQWSPDGRTLAINYDDRTVFWDPLRARRRAILPGKSYLTNGLAWSRDSRTFITWCPVTPSRNKMTFWDAGSARRRRVVFYGDSPAYWPVPSPDRKWIAAADGARNVIVWDFQTGQVRRRLSAPAADVERLAWSPDSRFLACQRETRNQEQHIETRIWDVPSGRLRARLEGAEAIAVAWSPDSRCFATAARGGGLLVWDRKSGRTSVLK